MKRFLALLIAIIVIGSVLPALASAESPKEEITLKILWPQNSGLRPAQDVSEVWDYIKAGTGINFERIVVQDAEQVNLLFASRDYPDLMANVGASFTNRQYAAEAGDLVDLGKYLPDYAPSWQAFFDENPLVYNMELIDGQLFSLPYLCFNKYDRGLRDQWLYVYPWLEEVGLDVPTTTDEFKEVLLAIKNAAGTGSIPENVIPFYILFDSYVGGQFDILGAFGVVTTTAEYLAVDPDGKVVSNAVNPDIIPALEYIQQLYKLGLIPTECFTDDWNTYLSKVSSNPPVVFSYYSFANRLPAMTYPMGTLDSGTGKKAYMRPQAYTANPVRSTMVFSKNPYIERTVEFFEWAAEYENVVTLCYGLEGVVWDYNEDGKFQLNFWEESQALMNEHAKQLGFNNSWFSFGTRDLYENHFYFPASDVVGTREWGYESFYKDQLPDWDVIFTAGSLDADSTAIMAQYDTDITNYRKQTIANWIMNSSDIRTEWDGYVAQMESLGLSDALQLKQQAYDLVHK
ncbi:ABC transporter substrate-binding protein [Clostridia bacterium]|nr:ABC transporter substrate-binding protein [Clostridia bacterium]